MRNPAVGAAIVVDGSGRTLYRLSSETARHLVCTDACLRNWLPLILSAHQRLSAGKGVAGRLTIIRRPHGVRQVALRGSPLYSFSGDRTPGEAFGRGIRFHHGQWQVIAAHGHLPRTSAGAKLPPVPPPD
jgi:predicted lipoprotein with Yx(FWY)xxD motif